MRTEKESFKVVESWVEAKHNSTGYQSSLLVSNLANNFKNSPPWDSLNIKSVNSRIMELIAAFSLAVKETKGTTIHVADVGGGNGYMGVYIKNIFPHMNIKWTVYESKEIASAYNEIAKDFKDLEYKSLDELFFDSTISRNKFDLVLLSCTLQYLEKPYMILDYFLKLSIPKIIMRIPFVSENEDIVTIQDFSQIGGYAGIEDISWPAWWFAKEKFLDYIKKNNKIILQWTSESEIIHFRGIGIPFEGLICI